ncbi:hypothetical protein RQP46_003930 [Phenoliferia psychrophenolica]
MRLPSTTLRVLSRSSRSLATASTSASAYVAPLKPGELAAYDQALLFLAADKAAKLGQLEQLKQDGLAPEVLERAEVDAWVNDPETRWRAKSRLGDMSKPVYRHLAERAWRKEGDLAVLMQRVTQMSVTPDLLPSISPLADVRISIAGKTIVPGVFALPSETREGVEVEVQVFHAEERLYTLLMIDPDVPDEASRSFTTYAHWLIPNIPLSSTLTTLPTSADALLPYIPPHPQQGTPYHRYTLLLLAQNTSINLDAAAIEREAFSVRRFVNEHALAAEGVSFWRAKWDESVTEIYSDVLGTTEPRFGKPPKRDWHSEPRAPKYQIQ